MAASSGSEAIAILGAGRVGSSLARLWVDAGEDVAIIASRRAARAKAAADFSSARSSTGNYPRAASQGSWVVLAVVDDALPIVVSRLAGSRVDCACEPGIMPRLERQFRFGRRLLLLSLLGRRRILHHHLGE